MKYANVELERCSKQSLKLFPQKRQLLLVNSLSKKGKGNLKRKYF